MAQVTPPIRGVSWGSNTFFFSSDSDCNTRIAVNQSLEGNGIFRGFEPIAEFGETKDMSEPNTYLECPMQTWEDYDTQRDKRFVWSQAMPSIDGAAGIFSAENWQPELHNRLAPSSFPTFLDQDWRRTVMSHMSRGSKYNIILLTPTVFFVNLKTSIIVTWQKIFEHARHACISNTFDLSKVAKLF